MYPVELAVRWLGGLGLLLALGVIFAGIARGVRQAPGRTAGRSPAVLRSPLFYFLASVIYFGLCYLLWQPIAVEVSGPERWAAVGLGAALLFGGLGLVIAGRLALGRQYFVSTTLGAQLYADHQLVTRGPYAWMRHPMYTGILLVGLGGILLYRTWTFVFVALHFVGLVLRARREEQALSAEFGAQWQAYCRQVPAFFPRLRRGSTDGGRGQPGQ